MLGPGLAWSLQAKKLSPCEAFVILKWDSVPEQSGQFFLELYLPLAPAAHVYLST